MDDSAVALAPLEATQHSAPAVEDGPQAVVRVLHCVPAVPGDFVETPVAFAAEGRFVLHPEAAELACSRYCFLDHYSVAVYLGLTGSFRRRADCYLADCYLADAEPSGRYLQDLQAAGHCYPAANYLQATAQHFREHWHSVGEGHCVRGRQHSGCCYRYSGSLHSARQECLASLGARPHSCLRVHFEAVPSELASQRYSLADRQAGQLDARGPHSRVSPVEVVAANAL